MGGGIGGGRVEVIAAKGCSRLFMDFSSSFRGISTFSLEPPCPAAAAVPETPVKTVRARGPFSGLVICVTGLSKDISSQLLCSFVETRKQVKEATERLGGQYSPHLHLHCTHLVVQISFSDEHNCNQIHYCYLFKKPEYGCVTLNDYYSFQGRKFEHAMQHGTTNGLLLVTIGWFVDSVKRNDLVDAIFTTACILFELQWVITTGFISVRLSETLYSVNSIGDNGLASNDSKRLDQNSGAENSCLPSGLLKHNKQPEFCGAPGSQFSERESKRYTTSSSLSGQSFYVDVDVPAELLSKVSEALSAEGATLVDQWFVGCNVNYVVCEGPSVQKYLGHSTHVVTPLWVLKSAKEKSLQRLVHLSTDLARYTGARVDNPRHDVSHEGVNRVTCSADKASHEARQIKVTLAKDGVRKRRNRQMQTCQTPIRPITPGSLLDSICWSVSEPTSTASIYTESSTVENGAEDQPPVFFDAKEDGKESESSFVNLSRPLTESEKTELILKGPFLTIMFPVDRYSEMGPCSRTFFSNKGFTCLHVLDYIYAFYQENMSNEEIEVAIYTDSRHADRLRSIYSSKETAECGHIEFRRIDFLGSRRSFEMLKRVQGDSNSNLYELLIRA
ncbi:hypothetical protein SASPL_153117 [Salvia splendens]|uniref:BRCT domain-containing protein n=1 Tax=Salvia splendens TaxID=180675 RepID=A0A8X8W495_SALSN|nr:hypothetical protein SASPL_153117 [Salvia splendens]